MIKIAELGDIVTYTGDMSYAMDNTTIELMKYYLVKGEKYIVDGYTDDRGYYKYHYIINLKAGRVYFPIESFESLKIKEYLKRKYNLK